MTCAMLLPDHEHHFQSHWSARNTNTHVTPVNKSNVTPQKNTANPNNLMNQSADRHIMSPAVALSLLSPLDPLTMRLYEDDFPSFSFKAAARATCSDGFLRHKRQAQIQGGSGSRSQGLTSAAAPRHDKDEPRLRTGTTRGLHCRCR